MPHRIRTTVALLVAAVALGISGCAPSFKRNPLPEALADQAAIPGAPLARFWADTDIIDTEAGRERARIHVEQLRASGIIEDRGSWLVLSGGGANGAFAAGLLYGWTESGDRPEFSRVTGVSTGALAAPYAFLGGDYDERLREVFTSVRTRDIIRRRWILTALFKDAVTSTDPLKRLIAEHITEDVIDGIAREHRRGRRLFIMTTNLDALRPVVWDIGAIAGSEAADRVTLIRSILLASASIPAAMPPVYFEVEAGGERYDEIHADGGATGQIYLYSGALDVGEIVEALAIDPPTVYIVRNARITPPWATVEPTLASIGGRTVASLVRTQGLGDLYQSYLVLQRDGFGYRLAFIPEDFEAESAEMFDPAYMTALFERARADAAAGYPWATAPPGYDPGDDGAPSRTDP